MVVGIPITLSWHRDANDAKQIDFGLVNYTHLIIFPPITPLISATNITQPYGTLNVTFPGSGCVLSVFPTSIHSSFDDHRFYFVEAKNETNYVATTRTFNVAAPSENGGGGNSTMPSYVASHS